MSALASALDEAVIAEVEARLAARELVRAGTARLAATEAAPAVPDAAALWAFATRDPSAPVDLAVLRAVRTDAATAARYRRLMAGAASAVSEVARAASTGFATERHVGAHRLRLQAGGPEDPTVLLLTLDPQVDPPPAAIEVFGEADGAKDLARVLLPLPVRGHILLPLNPANERHQCLARMVVRPDSLVWLL